MKYILRKEVSTVKLEDWDADNYLVATCILIALRNPSPNKLSHSLALKTWDMLHEILSHKSNIATLYKVINKIHTFKKKTH